MAKIILVTFTNGEVYKVPAMDIAVPRASYYADRDVQDDPQLQWQDVYDNEVANALDDPIELLDWFQNNMDWDDDWEQVDGPQPIDKWQEHARCEAQYEVTG